jgi:hypothetical protein
MSNLDLRAKSTLDAVVTEIHPNHWRLSIPAGSSGKYRLAQLDDYADLKRKGFPWTAPFTLRLEACASASDLPGTWGFGLWNDPFSISFGFGGGVRRFPALPNAAWFFFASLPNYLSFRDDLPAAGQLAATFHSLNIPAPLLALGVPALPLFVLRPFVRLFRRMARLLIGQDSAALEHDPTNWHQYKLMWQESSVTFCVDDEIVLETYVIPRNPLGLVIWIDNQYAAFPPNGKLGYGSLANEDSWIEVKGISVKRKM